MVMTLEERMRTVRFQVDDRPHIVVDAGICKDCSVQVCVYVCPASLFVPLDDGGILFNYEECFECGTCYIACNREGAIQWSYPRGGYGVTFRES
jgi:ferredoxin like protein